MEAYYEGAESAVIAASVGFVVFGLFNIIIALSAHSEKVSAINRDILHDRHQLMLNGLSLLLIILATELGLLQRILGLTRLNFDQWAICVAFAVALLLIDEGIKLFLRRRSDQVASTGTAVAPAPKGAY